MKFLTVTVSLYLYGKRCSLQDSRTTLDGILRGKVGWQRTRQAVPACATQFTSINNPSNLIGPGVLRIWTNVYTLL